MTRGRKAKPVALKVLQGNPGRRVLNTSIKFPVEKLNPPFFLRGDGLTEWNRIEPMLRSSGVVTAADRAVLSAYCRAYGLICEAEKLLEEMPPLSQFVTKGANGQAMRNPIARGRDEAIALTVRLGAELGLTPSSRNRVTAIQAESAVNPFEVISGGKK